MTTRFGAAALTVAMLVGCGPGLADDGTGRDALGSGGGGGGGGAGTAAPVPATPVAWACPSTGHPDSEVKETATGTNGSFTDTCTSSGDLIEYACAPTRVWKCSSWECYWQEVPGEVVAPRTVACAGTCRDGACPSVCPSTGTVVEFESLERPGNAFIFNAQAVLRDPATGRRWRCTSTWTMNQADFAALNSQPPYTVDRSPWPSQLCLPNSAGRFVIRDPSRTQGSAWTCVAL